MSDGRTGKHFNEIRILADPSDDADSQLKTLLDGFSQIGSGGIPGIVLTEVHPAGSRARDPAFDHSRAKEMSDLLSRSAFSAACDEEVGPEANIIVGKLLLSI